MNSHNELEQEQTMNVTRNVLWQDASTIVVVLKEGDGKLENKLIHNAFQFNYISASFFRLFVFSRQLQI